MGNDIESIGATSMLVCSIILAGLILYKVLREWSIGRKLRNVKPGDIYYKKTFSKTYRIRIRRIERNEFDGIYRAYVKDGDGNLFFMTLDELEKWIKDEQGTEAIG